jgi:hypothetical protein
MGVLVIRCYAGFFSNKECVEVKTKGIKGGGGRNAAAFAHKIK